jgi:hypothetical protein
LGEKEEPGKVQWSAGGEKAAGIEGEGTGAVRQQLSADIESIAIKNGKGG